MSSEDQDSDYDQIETDEIIDAAIGAIGVEENNSSFNVEDYNGEYKAIGEYLVTLKKDETMTNEEFRALKRKADKFMVFRGHLFKKGKRNAVPRRVICDTDRQQEVIKECHEGFGGGHCGRDGTQLKVSLRYYWEKLTDDVRAYVETCEPCQRQSLYREVEPLNPTWTSTIFNKIGVDIVHMPKGVGKKHYLVVARDDFTNWVEARALHNRGAEGVSRFLWEEIITRFGYVGQFTTDQGGEMKGMSEELTNKYGIPIIRTTAYHLQANGMVKHGHGPLVAALVKVCAGEVRQWPKKLHLVLWADRMTAKRTTGKSPFALVYGNEAVLPIEMGVLSWRVMDWDRVTTTEELLVARSKQLEQKDDDVDRAAALLHKEREKVKEKHDAGIRVRTVPLEVDQIVLLYDSSRIKPYPNERKFENRWNGPYRVAKVFENGSYKLKELDGTEIDNAVSGSRLKRFKIRDK